MVFQHGVVEEIGRGWVVVRYLRAIREGCCAAAYCVGQVRGVVEEEDAGDEEEEGVDG